MKLPFVRCFAVAALLLVSAEAHALTQPNGLQIPTAPGCNGGKPTGLLATFACACTTAGVCNIGTPCPSTTSCDNGIHGTCESTMWHVFNDNTCIPSQSSGLDPVLEAAVMPETFHPTCALTFGVVSRGTAMFQDVFGWYNVTSTAPAPSDLHPMINCGDAAGASTVLDIKSEPAYKGGDIGFFLLTPQAKGSATCSNSNCCPTLARYQNGEGYVYYSESKYNPDLSSGENFYHLLTYGSHIAKDKFYFAWEDTYQTSSGDFTDLVTSVEGVECSGAGQACDTGKQGLCAQGLTTCASGNVSCEQIYQSTSEVCNGVDDDCDGTIDDNATCPVASDVCQNGQCVHACDGGEFSCASGLACDHATNTCVTPACVGVTCPTGEICSAGTCATPCNGVVCPHNQTCVGDACVDLCAGKTCATGQTCSEGVCIPGCAACGGMSCAGGLTCNTTSGACANPSCPQSCPANQYCAAGACVDACAGAICPQGQTCANGQCSAPSLNADAGPGLVDPTQLDGGVGGNGAGAASSDLWGDASRGCGCGVTPEGGVRGFALFGLAVAIGAVRRRRRRSTPQT